MKPIKQQFTNLFELFQNNKFINLSFQNNRYSDPIQLYKKGNEIHIKKENRGKFTQYCGGKVTDACIQKGKHSPDPKIRKRATFAANARHFNHG